MTQITITTAGELVAQLTAANAAYRSGNAIMTDAEYDALEEQLKQLDPNHPFLTDVSDHVVQEQVGEYGREEALTIPMGSQNKALTLPEMASFYRATPNTQQYHASLKCDGMSMELTYRDQQLVKALTRGDGFIGVNVTEAVRRIPDVPKTIAAPGTVVVRGETMMTEEGLKEVNRRLTARNLPEYSNTRNGTVGIINTLKNLFLADCLTFMAFNIITVDE